MTGLIIESGINEELVPSVTTILDKKEKLGTEELDNMLKKLSLNNIQIDNINKYFNMNLDELLNTFNNTNNNKIKTGLTEIKDLDTYLKGIGINDICEFSISLARGQNYYTGNVFEVFDKSKKLTSSIGAGGRYDNIVGTYINDGNSYPAVGISFGLSSIFEILNRYIYYST